MCNGYVQQTYTCVGQSCPVNLILSMLSSFLHTIEHSSIPAQKLFCTRHEPYNVIGQPVVVVQETVMNLRQILHTSFLHKVLKRVSPARSQAGIVVCMFTEKTDSCSGRIILSSERTRSNHAQETGVFTYPQCTTAHKHVTNTHTQYMSLKFSAKIQHRK